MGRPESRRERMVVWKSWAMDWLRQATPLDVAVAIMGFCGLAGSALTCVLVFGIGQADAANAEKDQDRRITALEKADSDAAKELKTLNTNLVRLMVHTGVQPVDPEQ